MNISDDMPIGREFYKGFPNDASFFVPNTFSPKIQEDATRSVAKSNIYENIKTNTDLEKFADPDPLTKEEILDINESLNDIYLNRILVVSGELDSKSIIDKILEFADDE